MSFLVAGAIEMLGSEKLFNSETGIVSPKLRKQLELSGIVARQIFPAYDAFHIFNVEAILRINMLEDQHCCINNQMALFKFSFQQASVFLDNEYEFYHPHKNWAEEIVDDEIKLESYRKATIARASFIRNSRVSKAQTEMYAYKTTYLQNY